MGLWYSLTYIFTNLSSFCSTPFSIPCVAFIPPKMPLSKPVLKALLSPQNLLFTHTNRVDTEHTTEGALHSQTHANTFSLSVSFSVSVP